jgi:hypothetical protein
VTLTATAGSVTVAAPVTANATSGRAGEIAVRVASTVTLARGAQVSASGGQGEGVITVKAVEAVKLETESTVQANGDAGGTVVVKAEEGAVVSQGSIEVTGVEKARRHRQHCSAIGYHARHREPRARARARGWRNSRRVARRLAHRFESARRTRRSRPRAGSCCCLRRAWH